MSGVILRMRRRAAMACLLAAFLASCAEERGWRSLDSLQEFQSRFNEDAGRYRLILLLSPT